MSALGSLRGIVAGVLGASLATALALATAFALVAALALAGPAWAGEAFGVEAFGNSIVSNEAGAPATQAGSHPYALTTTIVFDHVVTGEEAGEPPRVRTYGDPKDVEVNLPAGTIVDPLATETRCTEAELERGGGPVGCPNAAAVGVFSVYLDGVEVVDEPVYNMAPPAGVPAELGFKATGIGMIVHVGGRVRSGGDYGLSADISNIPEERPLYALKLTLWGNPSEASHDLQRGLCADEEAKQRFKETGIRESCPVERTSRPFLRMPSSCAGEEPAASMSADSWQEPGALSPDLTPDLGDPRWKTATSSSPPLSGCERLDFSPSLTVALAEPRDAGAESPSGLSVDLKIPQEESPGGLAEASLKDAALTLPAGMAVSPSAAAGRAACTPQEIGLGNAGVPSCPDASKLGTAKILTPLLEDPLEGSLYLAQQGNAGPEQGANPFESLLALYLVAEGDGVLIKLAGKVEADPNTGRLTATFDDDPQLPFSELKLSFFGGPRALLVTPPQCGAYEARSALTPWSGTPAVTRSSTLQIDSGPNGEACPSGRFSPSFEAGTASNQAGAFSSFTLTFSRRDGEQRLRSVTVRMAPGLLGIMKSVALCPEPQASLGACPPASRIGTATVAVGPGGDPLYLPEPGRPANAVYLTGPYEGAPFGLSVVVPAIAGPFDLGDVIMRAKVEIDPHTAQLTVTSDPLPSIREGIPLDVRTIGVTVDRADFMFNPTDCAPLTVAATIVSAGGASAGVSSPFGAANCANLPFGPRLSVLTHAKTSRRDGAYLHVKVASRPGQANIGKVKVDLPKRLPSRLATLRGACRDSVFDADPASCPPASRVGTGTALTPVLKNPLTGPVYLVSHGGAAFPDLEIVLQGEGIVLDLDGKTKIEKGITSSAFRSLPDAPLSTFDLVLPAGPRSLLGANGNLCGQTLAMPTALEGQNGAVIHKTTRIAVSGCPKRVRVRGTRVRPKRVRSKRG